MPELIPAAPGSPEWLAARPAVKLSPWSRTGMIHGAYDAARPGHKRLGFHPRYVSSWQYRRGFTRAFLLGWQRDRHG